MRRSWNMVRLPRDSQRLYPPRRSPAWSQPERLPNSDSIDAARAGFGGSSSHRCCSDTCLTWKQRESNSLSTSNGFTVRPASPTAACFLVVPNLLCVAGGYLVGFLGLLLNPIPCGITQTVGSQDSHLKHSQYNPEGTDCYPGRFAPQETKPCLGVPRP